MKTKLYFILARNSEKEEYDFFLDWETRKVISFEDDIEAIKYKEKIEVACPDYDCIIKEFDLVEPF